MSRVGGKKDKTRGGIKGSALMQSSAHLSSAGGDDQQPCNYTVISDRGTERRGFCGLLTGMGTHLFLNLIHKIGHELVAQSEREKLQDDFKHI